MRFLDTAVKKIIVIFTIIVILFPIYALIVQSFGSTWHFPNLNPDYFTFDNYSNVFNWFSFEETLKHSILISTIVMVVSMIMGIGPAKYIGTKNFRGKVIAQILTMMPIMAPGIIVLFGMMKVFAVMGIYRTVLSLIIAECVFAIPYTIMVLVPIFKNYDCGIEDQAATLKISKSSVLMNITLPSIRSGLVVSCMYVFLFSWSIYLAVSLFAPIGYDTMASLLYPTIRNAVYSQGIVAAMTVLYFIPPVIFLFISTWIMGTDKVNNQRV